ncbi:MAG: asparagine synthetase B family protein [Betaproteobacteria bacterium]
MTALAGWVASARRPRDEALLAPMLDALAHRNRPGEDLQGRAERRPRCQVVTAVTVHDDAAQLTVAFDGAVANRDELTTNLAKRGYRLRGEGDAELVLRAYQHWDKDVVKQLRGAFAIALWDARKERLFLARDRFGEKPLYLQEKDGGVVFASELKGFSERNVDAEAVADYLAHGYVPGPRTLLAGVRKLAPGSYALWQFGKLTEIRYWTPPDGAPGAGEKPSVEAFIERLDEAVRLRAEDKFVNSGPSCGVFLSGGMDSAAIVALLARHGKRVSTFCAGFEGDKRSELVAAKRTAQYFGTDHHELVLAPRDVIARLHETVAQRDGPLARPSDVAHQLLAAHASRRVATVLTGEGGDEILGGYRRHALPGFLKTPGVSANLKLDPAASALRRMLFVEQSTWLPDQVLERADRVTMASSLEARAPYVDHRLAEYVSRLPDGARVRGFATKWILRQAARRLFPAGALKLRKAGFRIPVGKLLAGELKEFLIDHLRAANCATRNYYDPKALDRAIDDHVARKRNREGLLWTLLNLEIWHRTLSPSAPRG